MGRAKLEIKYREDFRARRSSYMTRMKGVRKKARELSVLCGVDVLVASFSPEFNTLEFWPPPEKDTTEFSRIRDRYLSLRKKEKNDDTVDEGNGMSEQQTPSPLMSSPLFSPEEEMAAIQTKLNEVRDRLCFLRGCSENQNLLHQCQEEEEWFHAQFMPLQQDFEPSSLFVQPSLCDSPLRSQSDDYAWCDSLILDHEYGS